MDQWLKDITRKSDERVKQPIQAQMMANWLLCMRAVNRQYPTQAIHLAGNHTLSKSARRDWYVAKRYLVVYCSNEHGILWQTVNSNQRINYLNLLHEHEIPLTQALFKESHEVYITDLITGEIYSYEDHTIFPLDPASLKDEIKVSFYLHPQCREFTA